MEQHFLESIRSQRMGRKLTASSVNEAGFGSAYRWERTYAVGNQSAGKRRAGNCRREAVWRMWGSFRLSVILAAYQDQDSFGLGDSVRTSRSSTQRLRSIPR